MAEWYLIRRHFKKFVSCLSGHEILPPWLYCSTRNLLMLPLSLKWSKSPRSLSSLLSCPALTLLFRNSLLKMKTVYSLLNLCPALALFPGSCAWAGRKELGTHCLRMLSFPRISGNLEIFRKTCSVTLTSARTPTSLVYKMPGTDYTVRG